MNSCAAAIRSRRPSTIKIPRCLHRAQEHRALRAAGEDNGDIAANGYNIAVSSYAEQIDTRSEAVDITMLNAEIARIVLKRRRNCGRRSMPSWLIWRGVKRLTD